MSITSTEFEINKSQVLQLCRDCGIDYLSLGLGEGGQVEQLFIDYPDTLNEVFEDFRFQEGLEKILGYLPEYGRMSSMPAPILLKYSKSSVEVLDDIGLRG